MNNQDGLIADGFGRARKANKETIRSEVEREFASKLKGASAADQKRIRSEMEHEIEKRLNKIAPPDALY